MAAAEAFPIRALRALTGRAPGGEADPAEAGERPEGPLIWVHLPSADRIGAFTSLADRAVADGDRLTLLMTCEGGGPVPALPPNVIAAPPPREDRTALRRFFDHWRPDLLIWTQTPFRPALLSEGDRREIPRILVDATAEDLMPASARWVPGLTRSLVENFAQAIAVDEEAAQRLRRLGCWPRRISVLGALEEDRPPPPCNETERADLARQIGTRPVWFARKVAEAEEATVLAAHHRAMRRTHRLLLVLEPADPARGAVTAATAREEGFRTILRSAGDEPDENTEILVADEPGEDGLWLRIAPVTFFGGSLAGEPPSDPMDAAMLGSAIVHGRKTGPMTERFHRLGRAGATRAVQDGSDLGDAVETLLSPEQSARMAHAGWSVASHGAEVSNRLLDILRDLLDRVGG